MLPADAPTVAIDTAANTVTITGTYAWTLLQTSSGMRVPSARTETEYAIRFPFAGSPFDPDFVAPRGGPAFSPQPGSGAAAIGDPKSLTDVDQAGGLVWGYYNAEVGAGVDPQGIALDADGVIDVGYYGNGFVNAEPISGSLDSSQYYIPFVAFNADFTEMTGVFAVKYDEVPLDTTGGVLDYTSDIYTWDAWGGFDSIEGGARVEDYRRENGIGTEAPVEEPPVDEPPVEEPPVDGGNPFDHSGSVAPVAVTGGATGDMILGGQGDDTLAGGGGSDEIDGGAGHDRANGGGGGDVLRGGAGNDTLVGAGGADEASGGAGRDRISGGQGDDMLDGDGGKDRIAGGGGDDTLSGGASGDRLDGGAGDDALRGDSGRDRLEGGAGGDTLDGGAGNDRLSGEGGGDTFVFDGSWGRDVVTDFDPGRDRLAIVAEVTDLDAFLEALRPRRGDTVYDADGDGANVIVFEGVREADFDGASVTFDAVF